MSSASYSNARGILMASDTKATWNRRDRHHVNAGKKRKAKESKNSTPSYDQLFAACGQPGVAVKK